MAKRTEVERALERVEDTAAEVVDNAALAKALENKPALYEQLSFAALEAVGRLSRCPSSFVSWAITNNDYVTDYVLTRNERLEPADQERVFFSARTNPSEMLDRGALSAELTAIVRVLLQNRRAGPVVSEADLLTMARKGRRGLAWVADYCGATPALLHELVEHFPECRQRVAGRHDLPPDLALRLATDDDDGVRSALAYNKKCPLEAMAPLALDQESYVAALALRRKKLQLFDLRPLGLREVANPIVDAERSAAAGKWNETAKILLTTWRAARDPSLADLLDRVPASPSDASLLATVSARPFDKAYAALRKLDRRPHDPRTTQVLLQVCRDVPFPGQDTEGYWYRVLLRLVKQADSRAIGPLQQLLEALPMRGVGLKRFMQRALPQAIEALIERTRQFSTSGTYAALDAILPRPEPIAPEPEPDPPPSDDLLERIRRDPDNDELRMIYADQLQEQGDVRGELIALQFRNDPGDAARIHKLLNKGRSRWSDGIKLVARVENIIYERGFPQRVFVKKSLLPRATWEDAAASPNWATVEGVWLSHKAAGWFCPALVLGGHVSALRWLVTDGLGPIDKLLKESREGWPPRLEGIGVRGAYPGKPLDRIVTALLESKKPLFSCMMLCDVGDELAGLLERVLKVPWIERLAVACPDDGWKAMVQQMASIPDGVRALHLSAFDHCERWDNAVCAMSLVRDAGGVRLLIHGDVGGGQKLKNRLAQLADFGVTQVAGVAVSDADRNQLAVTVKAALGVDVQWATAAERGVRLPLFLGPPR